MEYYLTTGIFGTFSTDRKYRLIEEPLLIEIAKKYGKTPAQVAIRHAIDRGISVIPKSRTPERVRENFDVSQPPPQTPVPAHKSLHIGVAFTHIRFALANFRGKMCLLSILASTLESVQLRVVQ